ncbi:MAG: sporulation protein [Bacteroidia bacterium]|nr:sporulation protein [Bacteroidia bacterium]
MGLLDKIKQFFGVGTVSVKLSVPASFSSKESVMKGSVTITGKSDQQIESVEVELQEKWTKGKGDDVTEKTFTLGSIKLNEGFAIKKDEVKTINFEVPYDIVKSDNDRLKEKGGVLGGLGKVGSFLDNERSEFSVICTVDVKGATFDPNDIANIKKVD